MKKSLTQKSLVGALLSAMLAVNLAPAPARAQQPPPPGGAQPAKDPPAPQERIAAIKKAFMESQAPLHSFEWIETTVISLKGEEKSRIEKRCYYGADGKIEKVLLSAPPQEERGRGLRGRIKENKKEELTEYMTEAGDLVHEYLPPDQEKIQACADAGNVTIRMIEPGKRAAIEFHDYLEPGDHFSVEIDLTDNTLLGMHIDAALDNGDPVTLDVTFDKLIDGTIYTAETELEAKAENVKVTVHNHGYREIGL